MVETGAVDTAATWIGDFVGKAADKNVLPIWEEYMEAVLRFSQGYGRDWLFPSSMKGIYPAPMDKSEILDHAFGPNAPRR